MSQHVKTENKELEDFAIKIKKIDGTYTGLDMLRFQSILEWKSDKNKVKDYDVWDVLRASSIWGTLTTYRRYLIKALGLTEKIFLKSFFNLKEEDKIKIIEYSNALKRIGIK